LQQAEPLFQFVGLASEALDGFYFVAQAGNVLHHALRLSRVRPKLGRFGAALELFQLLLEASEVKDTRRWLSAVGEPPESLH